MAKIGRPPLPEGERRINVSITLSEPEAEALRELAAIRGVSRGVLIGRFVLRSIARARAKAE